MSKIMLHCSVCGYDWPQKNEEKEPKTCARCKNPNWKEEKIISKSELPPQILTPDTMAQEVALQYNEQTRLEEIRLVPHPPFARNPDGTYNPKPMFALKRRLITEYHEKGHTAEWKQDFRIWFIESHFIAWNMPYILSPNSHTRAEIKKGVTEDFHSGYDLDKLVDSLCDEACRKPEAPAQPPQPQPPQETSVALSAPTAPEPQEQESTSPDFSRVHGLMNTRMR